MHARAVQDEAVFPRGDAHDRSHAAAEGGRDQIGRRKRLAAALVVDGCVRRERRRRGTVLDGAVQIALILDIDIDHAADSGKLARPRPAMEIVLLRHGESEGNAQGRMQGRRDYPLSALGREQATRAGAFIAQSGLGFAAVYCSPLKRASETAGIVAACGVRPEPVIDEDLPEIGAGSIEGLNEAEIRAAYPPFMERPLSHTGDFGAYGGESYDDVQSRVARLWTRLEARHREPGDRVLLVGHGGFHYQLTKALLCDPVPRVCILKFGNCTVSLIRMRERRGLYLGELVFHMPVELMGGTPSGEGAGHLFR